MSDSRAEDEAAIQAVLVDSYNGWEAGDADAMVADYTADATAILPGSLRDSRDVIRQGMAMAFEGPLKGSSTINKQLSLRFVGRDAAIVVTESGILFAGQTEVPDTYLRAWRAREQYDETRSSLRTWLYRIATNVCLTALEVRGRRPLPSGLVAASDPLGPLVQGENVTWFQPLPDSLLAAGDPASAVIDRSGLRLAFAAALQHLSARQRGALILRDVLSFSASEAAEILGTTVVSVNSSLQRARTRVKEVGVRQERLSEPSAAEQRAWVDRYMEAGREA
jgi:uncharacterized protein (TIGR02246 family)